MIRKTWRYMIILLTLWLLILGYMGWHLFVLVDDSNKNRDTLVRKEKHVELLQSQNQKLKEIVSDLQAKVDLFQSKDSVKDKKYKEAIKRIQDASQRKVAAAERASRQISPHIDNSQTKLSTTLTTLDEENLKRRIEYEVKELWYYASAQITKVIKRSDSSTSKRMTNILSNIEMLHHYLSNDLEKLKSMKREWQEKEHKQLSELVQQRIDKLQNPKDCASTKKLICQLNKSCGYGCQAHHVLYCFIIAFGLQRTMIIDSTGWRYSSKGWKGVFLPISKTCLQHTGTLKDWRESNTHQNVILPIVDSLYPRPPYMPLAVPEDLSNRLSTMHGHPFVWWIGQFAKYLFRYAPEVQKEIDAKKAKLGFQHPIVGLQVRRTDKINTEAAFHSIEEYMYWVKLYYERRSKVEKIDTKRVFLATDDPSVLPEAKEKYPDYEFVSDVGISKSAGLGSRYTDTSLHGVIFDIQMLSECDFLVCTFSSQVCRLGYEIMQSKHPDASKYFQSLDDIYYFGGQSGHNVRAIVSHTPENQDEISLEVGDLIGIAGNHWDGYSKGHNFRTGQVGLYPSWKVEEVLETAKFPTYDD
ncbi:alpha-(1,6)-fucosyltransferase [Exaiptasia diaphana]|uniref:Alpha-(1,6)-fucosyltransferase n=1 Tax=Exaiptasia diaphana TaxID=2652724 RepID=A0A913XD56_EXADI|nr:alpha-(1,6)-fucosyltransferase [Exaiptasia diaphana]KXJ29841.1 Alpha-(1,6)-fucosyltransferase [Exaiptasia diaphana]